MIFKIQDSAKIADSHYFEKSKDHHIFATI